MVTVLCLEVAPLFVSGVLDTEVVDFWRVPLVLSVLKYGVSYFHDIFNFDASVGVLVDADQLLVASPLKWDDL